MYSKRMKYTQQENSVYTQQSSMCILFEQMSIHILLNEYTDGDNVYTIRDSVYTHHSPVHGGHNFSFSSRGCGSPSRGCVSAVLAFFCTFACFFISSSASTAAWNSLASHLWFQQTRHVHTHPLPRSNSHN